MGSTEDRISSAEYFKIQAKLERQGQKYDEGFSANKLKTEKLVRDLLNKYKSHLQQQTQSKLDRTPNFKYETELQAKISVLNELKSKL